MQLRGHWYRGGTSKCWLFDADDVDLHAASREEVLMLLADAFGAADARQLDGVGGGTSTASKAAVIWEKRMWLPNGSRRPQSMP